MNQKKSAKASLLKYSLIVPLALALVVSSNAQTVINKAKRALTTTKEVKATEKKSMTAPAKSPVNLTAHLTINDSVATEKTWDVVEKMPQYPGGDEDMIVYLEKNIKYPLEAQKKGTEGRVIVSFIVSSTGKVVSPKILRGVDTYLDQEAVRIVSTFPTWIPGEQNGEKVSVRYTLPVTFRLNGGATTSDTKTEETWRKNLVVIVNGIQQPSGFDFKSVKAETIEKINVLKPDTEEKRTELVAKYGENASNGVIEITKK